MLRPCLDCKQVFTVTKQRRSRCDRCQAQHRRAHKAARGAWSSRVAQGNVRCSRCSKPIGARDLWDIDRYRGQWHPAHRACNRAASGGGPYTAA